MAHIGIGMRSIKTGLAVLICLAIYTYTPLNDPVLAVLVAVSAIQNSIDDSVTFSKNRIMGTILGTILGIVYRQIASENLLLTAIGVIVLITLLNKLNQSKSILIAMTVFVSIITGRFTGNSVMYGLNKCINTIFGITIGFLINYFIQPPSQIENMKTYVMATVKEIELVTHQLIFANDAISLDQLSSEIKSMQCSLNMYNQDQKYNAVVMDKIKHVEKSMLNYTKLYSQLELIRDKRARLNEENRIQAQEIFNQLYECQENIEEDSEYTIVYNYHIHQILEEIKNIRKALSSISHAQAVKPRWKIGLKVKK